jgi:hypothetical protein
MSFLDEVRDAYKASTLPDFPSFGQMGINYLTTIGVATTRKVLGLQDKVSTEEKDRRLAICKACEHIEYVNEKPRCHHCGCNMEKGVDYFNKRCALGKWEEMVSVIIPNRAEKYIDRTVQSIKENAIGPIEIIIEDDPDGLGNKVIRNRGAKKAKGEYLFFVDGHCIMTKGWDVQLKAFCGEKDLVQCRLDGINEDTWTPLGNKYDHVYLNKDLKEKWWNKGKDNSVEELMCLTGCGFLLRRKRFFELGGYYEEPHTQWGSDGPEWGCKIWLSGGRCFLHTGVVCAHLFRKQSPFLINGNKVTEFHNFLKQTILDKKLPLQIYSIDWLVDKFKPVPTWDN